MYLSAPERVQCLRSGGRGGGVPLPKICPARCRWHRGRQSQRTDRQIELLIFAATIFGRSLFSLGFRQVTTGKEGAWQAGSLPPPVSLLPPRLLAGSPPTGRKHTSPRPRARCAPGAVTRRHVQSSAPGDTSDTSAAYCSSRFEHELQV